MEDIVIIKNKFTLIRGLKTSISCESINQRRYVSKISFIIIITLIFGGENRKAYGQIQLDNNKKQKIAEAGNGREQVSENEISNFFTVDNNTYKVLGKDDNTVIFWKHENIGDSESIIINNEVRNNEINFKVKYIYEKAFSSINGNIKNIVIGNEVIGFCDLYGNTIKALYGAFKDKQKIETINFENGNFMFGPNYFQNCASIQAVEVPKSMNIMEGYCFDQCYSLKHIDLSEITKFNGQNCFSNCFGLEYIGKLNNEVTELPDRTFTGCSNLKIDSLNNITKLGNECFKSCKLLNEKIVTDVEEIGSQCFVGCLFGEIYLRKAKKIGYNAFARIWNRYKKRAHLKRCAPIKKVRQHNQKLN